ncbi:hypothetical protein D3C81_945040 [compost metagenome]
MSEKFSIRRQPRIARVVVDFDTAQRQALRLPIGEHLQNLRGDLILIQRLELAVETNHRNQRTTIGFQ